MSVTDVSLSFAGATGKASRGGKSEYTAHYIATTNNWQDQPQVVLTYFKNTSSLPHPDNATPYSYGNDSDSTALCDSLSPRRDANHPNVWKVVAHFGDAQKTKEGEDENGNPTEDPLKFALDITQRFAKTKRPVYKADYIEGYISTTDATLRGRANPQAVVNSGLVPFDPPLERDSVTEIISVTGNFGGLFDGERAGKFINTVNNNRIRIARGLWFFWAADAYQAKIQNIVPDRKRTNGITYWRIAFEIECDREFGWRYDVLDRGVSRRACGGDPDGYGGTFSTPTSGKAAHASIVDAEGHPITEPVLFNGDGQPIDVCTEDPVFGTWRLYPEKDFRNIPLIGQIIT